MNRLVAAFAGCLILLFLAANDAVAQSIDARPFAEGVQLTPRLSDAQLMALKAFLTKNGVQKTVHADTVAKLGVPAQFLQVGLQENATGLLHYFASLPDRTYIFGLRTEDGAYSYHVDGQFRLLNATVVYLDAYSDKSPPEAGADAELVWWAAVANQLLAGT